MWKEILVFVHGVTPASQPEYHARWYDSFVQRLNKQWDSDPFDDRVYVEWGWPTHLAAESGHLARAEQIIGSTINLVIDRTTDWHIRISRLASKRLRDLFMYGFADMFFYVSQPGKEAIRNDVFNQIKGKIDGAFDDSDDISLTFIAHSAGTVITHDLLFHIFSDSARQMDYKAQNAIDFFRNRAGKLRIRKVFTLGSPLAPLMVRSPELIKIILEGQRINPEDLGLYEADELSNPRWVNYWDIDDLISAPLEDFYARSAGEKIVADEYPDSGDSVFDSHERYFHDSNVAKSIAKHWN